jgi:small GTP-binding protein
MQQDPLALKIVILGNSGVGKTSLITRLKTGECPSHIDPTVGVNHQCHSVQIGKDQIRVFLWDTAGQEQFQALTPLYCHSASGALIVCAINDIESFKAIPKWLEFLETSCLPVPPVVLVVNKVDRQADAVLQSEEISERFRPKFRSIFFASAMTGESVENVFTDVAEAAFEFQGGPVIPMEKSTKGDEGCC